jgi:ABC-2 type transport system ATP-binding protein
VAAGVREENKGERRRGRAGDAGRARERALRGHLERVAVDQTTVDTRFSEAAREDAAISAKDAAVKTEHLTKIYKDFWGRDKVRALDDLNLTIRRGEVFGLLGPNGSGKSTTIKLLLGLIFATRGRAWVLGKEAGDTTINERVGFLPEESYLYRFLNGEETLKFYGRLFKIPRAELNRRVPELLDIVGLDAKARKRKLRRR